MRIREILVPTAKILGCAAIVTCLYFFCLGQTKGFRPYLILSNIPSDPRWEVTPLRDEEQLKIDALLDQPFTYFGSGGWCFAFLGEDKKTILKFYRHDHFFLSTILRERSFEKLLLKAPTLPREASYFQEFNFKSCVLLYNQAKERTGLLYVHLNKTPDLHKPVTLYDNIGIKHTIDLNKTEFVVQKRATLLFEHIDSLAKQKKIEEAKLCIDDITSCMLTLFKGGLRDLDLSLHYNFGYTEDGAVTLDLSSFVPDDSLKKPGEYRKELIVKTRGLSRFLSRNHPELHAYFEKRLSEALEND